MTIRRPLVLADDGLVSRLQATDTTPESKAVAQMLIQNNTIIRLLACLVLESGVSSIGLSDTDIEQFIAEIES